MKNDYKTKSNISHKESIKLAHQKIKEMEESLKYVNDENDFLKLKVNQAYEENSNSYRLIDAKTNQFKKKLASISTSMYEDTLTSNSNQNLYRQESKSISPIRSGLPRSNKNNLNSRSPHPVKKYLFKRKDDEYFD